MTSIKYTPEQIQELKNNKSVKNCTEKYIVFEKAFKVLCIEESSKYMTSKEIFKKYGFPQYILQTDIPNNAIARWKRNIKKTGNIEENKGRKKREYRDTSKMSKDEYIRYLEAENALLKELKKRVDGKYP